MAGSGEVIVNYLPANTSPTTDDKVMVLRNADGELTNVTLADIKTLITQGSSGIFWVTYNITTYSEIRTADVSGKLPVLRMNVVSSNSYTTSEFYLSRLTNSSAVFVADQPATPGVKPMVIVCDSNDVWSMDYSKYDSDYVAYDSSKSYSAGTVGLKLTELGGAVPSPYSSDPAVVGAPFVGSSNAFARGDHAHDLSSDLKAAILQLASKVAYIDDQGQTYYQDLYDALYPGVTYAVTNTLTGCTTSNSAVAVPENSSYSATISPSSGYSLTGATVSVTMGGVNITDTAYNAGTITIASVTGNIAISVAAVSVTLSSISAVYTQSGTVYTDDSLDSLKSDLVVTATWSDTSTTIVPGTEYTLSGTLAEGTQTITVLYSGDTATFTVACTVRGWLYHFNESILSSGAHDFGLLGVANYADGVNQGEKCYYHHVATEGDSTTDPLGLYNLASTDYPTWANNDFTISCWFKDDTAFRGHMFAASKRNNSGTLSWTAAAGNIASGWTVTKTNANKAYSGVRLGTVSQQLYFSLTNEAANAGGAYSIVPPSAFDSTQWHHYALTRSNGTIYYFVDGNLICTVPLASSVALYTSDSITIGNLLKEDTNTPTIVPYPYSSYHQDLYIAVGYCKWTSNFDPSNITY